MKNSFTIKDILIEPPLVLAPMAGISNPAYIKICEEMGVGLAFTELISSEAIVRNNKKTMAMLNGFENIHIPVGIQIFGSDSHTMAQAAKILCDHFPQVKLIDINMGCPVPKVALRANAGSALLKDLAKIKEIVASVVAAVKIPVTVKIRSGWDSEHINAIEVAKVCESAGASAITVHARTRAQGYSGKSDWQIIKQVKESVAIPVIGNGDITSPEDCLKMLELTGCDAVMIGRATMGNPWIFKECLAYLQTGRLIPKPTYEEKIAMIETHYQLLKEDKGEKWALLEIRTHALAYLKNMPEAKRYKEQICKSKTETEFLNILDNYKKELKNAS